MSLSPVILSQKPQMNTDEEDPQITQIVPSMALQIKRIPL
jgi:hypothetical protein